MPVATKSNTFGSYYPDGWANLKNVNKSISAMKTYHREHNFVVDYDERLEDYIILQKTIRFACKL